MSDDEGEDDDFDPEEVREALRVLRAGGEDASLGHVLTLVIAADRYAVPIVPPEAIAAVDAKYSMDRDVANGGMDQVVWNHGEELARAYASAFRAVGAIENADLLDRLAGELERYRGEVTDAAISSDPVKHFLAYRAAVGGPFFGIPEPGDELAEAVLEFVIERGTTLPDPDQPLPAKDHSS
jgi:hypothetical protein